MKNWWWQPVGLVRGCLEEHEYRMDFMFRHGSMVIDCGLVLTPASYTLSGISARVYLSFGEKFIAPTTIVGDTTNGVGDDWWRQRGC